MNNRSFVTVFLFLLLFISFLFLSKHPIKNDFVYSQQFIKKSEICSEKTNQYSIYSALAFASKPEKEIKKIEEPCDHREYTWATLDEKRLRILKLYTELALTELNRRCKEFSKKNFSKKPFFFKYIQIINATSSVDKKGNSRWRVDIMVQEMELHFSQRLILDFTVIIDSSNCNNKCKTETCAEYTSKTFPRYPFGYPALEQLVPLPSQVINTGPGLTLSNIGIDKNYPDFKDIYLNKVWIENSDLVLGTELPTIQTTPALNDTSLESSMNQEKIVPKNNLLGEPNDIQNKYLLSPFPYQNITRSCFKEKNNHLKGSSETYQQSVFLNHPKGWIQPSVLRNKWPRLWSEPNNRYAWPSTPIIQKWNQLGIYVPQPEPSKKHPGIRWSTEQQPRTPNYWPTVTGLPVNAGPNYWLFNNTRGFVVTQPH
jgi:hypothetical protein